MLRVVENVVVTQSQGHSNLHRRWLV